MSDRADALRGRAGAEVTLLSRRAPVETVFISRSSDSTKCFSASSRSGNSGVWESAGRARPREQPSRTRTEMADC